jgi:hypothetical protein
VRRINWLLFFAVLLAPTLLTIVVVKTGKRSADAAVGVALLGGVASGITCGILLGRRVGKSAEARVGLSIVFALILCVVCIGINCFGCLAGGYKLDLR